MKKLSVIALLVTLFAVQVWAAISVGMTTTDGDSANTVTTDAIDTTGATAIAIAVASFTSGGLTVSDSKSNTWTPLTQECSAADNCIQLFFFCGGTVGSSHTFTAAGTSKFPAVIVFPLAGTLTASCSDGESSGGNTTSTTSVQPGTLTPSRDNGIVITAIGFLSDHTDASIDGGFSDPIEFPSDGANFDGIAGSYLIQTTAAATNPTWTWTSGTHGAAVSAAFKVAAAATTPNARRRRN